MALTQQEKIEILSRVFGADAIYQIPRDHDEGQGESLGWSALDRWNRTGRFWVYLDIAKGECSAGQSTSLDRSNYRSLLRDYPGTFTPVRFTNVDVLGAYISDLDEETVSIVTGLKEQYPVYDESDMSGLEHDEVAAAWDDYMRWDFDPHMVKATTDEQYDLWCATDEDAQRRLFYDAMQAADYYPEHSGYEVCWDEEKLSEMAEWIVALAIACLIPA
jgi:hypothetical protein